MLAILLFALATPATSASAQCASGLHSLLAGLRQLDQMVQEVARRSVALVPAAAALNESATAAAVCYECGATPNSTSCRALESGSDAIHTAAAFAASINSGWPEIERISLLLQSTTRWHSWAAVLPLFALGCISSAVVLGSIYGRRNLLVLAQFGAVVIWWMMCAVLSVEFAISVGLADFCIAPFESTMHVLLTVARGDRSHARPSDLWTYNLTAHYLSNCSVPNPLAAPLLQVEHVCSLLPPVGLPPEKRCAEEVRALARPSQQLQALAALQLDGEWLACGGNGTIASLFASGVQQGVCEDIAAGFVGTFLYQLIGGMLLLLVSLLLPALWHSHQLPPLVCRRPQMPQWRALSGVSMRSMRDWQRLTPLASPLEPSRAADLDAVAVVPPEQPITQPPPRVEPLEAAPAQVEPSVHESASTDRL